MPTLFISDLHLDPRRPQITELFGRFLEQRAVHADALYILGDLFEAWIGDDDDAPLAGTVADALTALPVPVYFAHGNRDFLLGKAYAGRCGMTLLEEETVIDLYGRPTLILHGDSLCTDDHDYQRFRQESRQPAWRRQVLALPLDQRRVMASRVRELSMAATRMKPDDITDVNPEAVAESMTRNGVSRMIHGHTHRPALHHLELPDGSAAERWVLGDWYEQGSVLICTADGCRMEGIGNSRT